MVIGFDAAAAKSSVAGEIDASDGDAATLENMSNERPAVGDHNDDDDCDADDGDEETGARLLLSSLAGLCVREEDLLLVALVFATVFCFNTGGFTSCEGNENVNR